MFTLIFFGGEMVSCHVSVEQSSANFLIKGDIRNFFNFPGYMISKLYNAAVVAQKATINDM